MQIVNCVQWTQEWLEARAGKITGTRLQKVMGSKKTQRELIYELTAEKMAPLVETYQSGAMERWHLVETVVKELYTEPVMNAGFVIKNEWIWISPDWLIQSEDGIIRKALEVKWPQPKNTIKYWVEDSIPDEYFWQTVHYFICIDTLEELDFTVCNPDVYDSFFRMKTKTVTRDELSEYIEMAKVALANFYPEWIEVMNKLISLKPKTVWQN